MTYVTVPGGIAQLLVVIDGAAPLMDTVVIGLILAIWTFLVLPAVMIQFLPRNPESQAKRASRTGGPFSFMSSQTPRDTNGGQAVA